MIKITDLRASGNKVFENGPSTQQRGLVCEVNGQNIPERLQGEYARLFSWSPRMLEFCFDICRQVANKDLGNDNDSMVFIHNSELQQIMRIIKEFAPCDAAREDKALEALIVMNMRCDEATIEQITDQIKGK
jgi:hypothetical protein